MKKFTEVINYWLFKPIPTYFDHITTKYHYVRVQKEGSDSYRWVIGYENKSGGVSIISAEPNASDVIELEKDFQMLSTHISVHIHNIHNK
jgi:hypothetical protein